MNKKLLRTLAIIPGIPMLFNGIGFLTQPQRAAASLDMTLLDGLGRSTQIGDTAAFFVGVSALIFIGCYTLKGRWLYAAAMFLGLAAFARLIAAQFHGAEFAVQFIVVELVLTLWLCLVAYYVDKPTD